MGNQGFIGLHNEQGVTLVCFAMGLLLAIIVFGAIAFKFLSDRDREARKLAQEKREANS